MKFFLVCLSLIFCLNIHAQKTLNVSISDIANTHFSSNNPIKFSNNKVFSSPQTINPPGKNCYDSSFTKPFSFANEAVSVYNTLHTSDDGMLVCGDMYDTTKYPPYTHLDGFIMKMDDNGNILWVKKITDTKQHSSFYLFVHTLKEISNHDIIAMAALDTADGFNDIPVIFKLDESGKLIWYKSFQTSLFSSEPLYDLSIDNVTEATNGDLIFTGTPLSFTSDDSYQSVVKMNAQGDVLWSDNFGNNTGFTAGDAALGAFLINGNIVECGLSFGGLDNDYITAINFLTLDYANGNLLNKTFYVPNYSSINKNQNKGLGQIGNVKCKLLNNGHYLIYGVIDQDNSLVVDSTDYFGVAEFDASFDLVNSYLISSANETSFYSQYIEIADNNKAYYSLGDYTGLNQFFISDNGNQSSKSRKFDQSSASPFILFNDGGYGFIQYKVNDNNLKFIKLHDDDTISGCFGTDSLLTMHAPYNLKKDPQYQYLDNNIPNKVSSYYYKLSVSNFTDYNTENGCVQKNNCDSIHIHGTTNICGPDDAVYFTATRNKNCGAFAQWSMDTSVFTSLRQVDDTTVAVKFKKVNWDGKLYAHLQAPSCNINPPIDSIQLHVTNQTVAKLSLGTDTIFCQDSNPLVLHAGPDFKTYTWQDGSTDSTIAVTTTGKYFVTVTDKCNNLQSDTINATIASDAFKIGNDTTKCNNDTITLKAPVGFSNYSWLPNYNIQKITVNEVQVFPFTNTSYVASAEMPGCNVHDSVFIQVLHSPGISLGNDTSICYGSKLLLDAGGGFDQYSWSNGLQTRSIYADSVGVYSVAATADNHCSSFDTINIISVNPQPFVSLGNDTMFCSGDELILAPVIKNADKYYWQNGNTSSSIIIKQQGEYFLTASNTCGSYTDSIKVSEAICKLFLPSAFTPNHDGLNDIFKPKYPFPVKSYKMIIYNRWGQQVFVSEDITTGWDGNYKGLPVSSSTYIWIVSITDTNNVKTSLHGTVTVIR